MCFDRGNLFSSIRNVQGVAMSPGVYVIAGTDSRIALFLAPFNKSIIIMKLRTEI